MSHLVLVNVDTAGCKTMVGQQHALSGCHPKARQNVERSGAKKETNKCMVLMMALKQAITYMYTYMHACAADSKWRRLSTSGFEGPQ